MSLKIVSYNIHKGLNPMGLSQSLQTVKRLLMHLKPDVVLLQEVIGAHTHGKFAIEDWVNQSQFEFLADEFWPHYAYGKNAIYEQGNHGNCILSKYPISYWQNTDISTNRLEQRGLLHATIDLPHRNKKIDLMSTHLNLLQNSRKKQVHKIVDYIKANVNSSSPLILGGDFNDWQNKLSGILNDKLGLREVNLELEGRLPKTFPSHFPMLRLDRIYFKNITAISTRFELKKVDLQASDHIPVVGLFQL